MAQVLRRLRHSVTAQQYQGFADCRRRHSVTAQDDRVTRKRAEVPVDSIIVDDEYGRVRDDANIDAELVERFGLIYPITCDENLRLLAGDQWLAAVKKLGWPTVEVLIVEAA
jgi:hypothetical protein